MKRMTLLLGIVIPLAACESGRVTSDPCDGWTPFRPRPADVLTVETARWGLGHNGYGQRRCGWRP